MRKKAKIEADACGQPRPRDDRCPACLGHRIFTAPRADFPLHLGIDSDLQGCLDCSAIWEPFPAIYVRDPVCADPCDNCAFRPGSPEQADPVKWKALIATLKPNGDDWWSTGRFYCHKAVPIDMTKGPGNFLFPEKPITADGEPVLKPDGSPAMHWDVAKMRTCSGFLRMCWARAAKTATKSDDL